MAMLAEVLAARGSPLATAMRSSSSRQRATRLHYSNWRIRVWLPARAAAGLPDLNFHDLKHTAGTALLDEGINIKTAQARLGHANPQTTLASVRPGHRPGGPRGRQPAGRAFVKSRYPLYSLAPAPALHL